MPEKPLELSRYCVPFTPFKKTLEESTLCLVTTAAVRHKDDTPFNLEGDATFRTIARGVTTEDLKYDDAHYDHACVDQDLNCVFPIDRLSDLAHDRRIGGLTESHFSLGYSQALRDLREQTIPGLVREIDRVRPDAVLLTGG
jgi:D-proline reductase (dithiol) PrdB